MAVESTKTVDKVLYFVVLAVDVLLIGNMSLDQLLLPLRISHQLDAAGPKAPELTLSFFSFVTDFNIIYQKKNRKEAYL